MSHPTWIEIAALAVSLVALGLSWWSFRHTRRNDEANLELQRRLLALESTRERAKLRDQRRASIRAAITEDVFGSGGTFLIIRNDGPAEARDVKTHLDGVPAHESGLIVDSSADLPILGPGGEAPFQLYLGGLSDPVTSIQVEVAWADDSGEPGRFRSTLIAP